jgi:hypothetical protein
VHPVLAAQFRDRHTAFGLAQDRKNLGVAISRHLHQNLLRYLAEKILLPHPLSFGGDYPRLSEFISKKMRMSHIYQPVMIRELLIRGGHHKGVPRVFLKRNLRHHKHRIRGFCALFDEMIAVKSQMVCRGLEMMGRQGYRVGRNAGLELGLHQSIDHCRRNKVMAINTTIHNERGTHDGVVTTPVTQGFREKWHFKRTGHIKNVDPGVWCDGIHAVLKPHKGLVNNVGVPVRLDKRDIQIFRHGAIP